MPQADCTEANGVFLNRRELERERGGSVKRASGTSPPSFAGIRRVRGFGHLQRGGGVRSSLVSLLRRESGRLPANGVLAKDAIVELDLSARRRRPLRIALAEHKAVLV